MLCRVPGSIPPPQTFASDGEHVASGTVSDNAGNRSAPGAVTVQVDAGAPVIEISCPASAPVGAQGIVATITASDGQSGLASDPSGTVPIDTSTAGAKTVTRTAVDNVGHSSEASCTTQVEHGKVITGTVKGTLTVGAGEDIELAPSARVTGAVKVKAGGALDVEGATFAGTLSASHAGSLRICGASIAGTVKLLDSAGPVVIGDGGSECAASTFAGTVTIKGAADSVSVEGVLGGENVFHGSLKVSGASGATTVTDNLIAGALTVEGNAAPVIDTPNSVEGTVKLQ